MSLGEYTDRRAPRIIAAALEGADLTLAAAERRHVEMVLRIVKGDLPAAARLLGVSRRLLERKGYRSRYPRGKG